MECPKCKTNNPDEFVFCSKCGTQISETEEKPLPTQTIEAPKEELTTGSTFVGRYQIIEELGKGGMGKVYKANDTDIKEKVAIKLIKPEISTDKKTIERFQNELKFARKIRHKNVCQMYDLNKAEGSYYITMEYVEGENLKNMIRMSGQLGMATAISVAKQVCEGLTEAHKLGVIHRDLKPSNIMIDREGSVRIMDFGIARSLSTKGITGAGIMIGTPDYMSPEQVEGKEVDQRSDIYSLGIMLYEMVTGRVPFEGDTPFTIGMKHKGEIPQEPKELNAQIPEDLSRVIMKCLEKDKEKRYQSAGEVRSELGSIEKGIPTTERAVPERKPFTSKEITVQFNLKKLFVPALIFIAVVIAGFIIWRVLPKEETIQIPTDRPSLAVMYFENNTGDESLDHWSKMLSDLLITDLSQSKYLRILSGEKLYKILSELDQLEAQTYSQDVLSEVANQGQVNHLLLGKYAKMGDVFRIDVVIQEANTGEIIGSERVEARGEVEVFPQVDELTLRVKSKFKLSEEQIASDLDKEVGKITTSSPAAYKLFVEGIDYFLSGNWSDGIQLMEKAVAIDPEFAAAYHAMGAGHHNLGNSLESRKNYQKAFKLKDRVSEKEYLMLKASEEENFVEKMNACLELKELYPDDAALNNRLSLLYSYIEENKKAIELMEINRKRDPDAVPPHWNLSCFYAAEGSYDKVEEILEYYLNSYSDNAFLRWRLAINYYCQGKYGRALAEATKANARNPVYYMEMLISDIYFGQGDLTKAEELYQRLLESDNESAPIWARSKLGCVYLTEGKFKDVVDQWKMGMDLAAKIGEITSWNAGVVGFHFYLAYVYLLQGKSEAALEEWKLGWSDRERDVYFMSRIVFRAPLLLYLKGRIHVENEELQEALRTANEIREIAEKLAYTKGIRYHHLLMGLIELKNENYLKAIEYLEQASSLLPFQSIEEGDDHAIFMEPLALAYYRSDDLEKARVEYEKITTLTTGRIYYGDVFARAFYMLGKIYEKQGIRAKAIDHYEKFLDLWKDADPGIPEVEDARERLAGLTTNQ